MSSKTARQEHTENEMPPYPAAAIKKASDTHQPGCNSSLQHAPREIIFGAVDVNTKERSVSAQSGATVVLSLSSVEFSEISTIMIDLGALPEYEDSVLHVFSSDSSITIVDKLAPDSSVTCIENQDAPEGDNAIAPSTVKSSKRAADKDIDSNTSKKQKNSQGNEVNKAKRKNKVYLDTAIPPSKDLPDIVMGAIEFNTFFPQHSRWPAFYVRFYRNGWRARDIAKAQLHARGTLTKANWDALYDCLRYQVVTAIRSLYPGNTPTSWVQSGHLDAQPYGAPPSGNHIDLYTIGSTTPAFQPPAQITVNGQATLAQVVHGVVNWPQGQDRGCLTQALAWAQAQPGSYMTAHTTADLAQIMTTLSAQGIITAPSEATSTSTWDQSALARLQANVASPR